MYKYLSNFKAERMQLKTNKLYNLKIVIETVVLTSVGDAVGKALMRQANLAAGVRRRIMSYFAPDRRNFIP